METLDLTVMAVMAGMGFVAAFIDSIVGGELTDEEKSLLMKWK